MFKGTSWGYLNSRHCVTLWWNLPLGIYVPPANPNTKQMKILMVSLIWEHPLSFLLHLSLFNIFPLSLNITIFFHTSFIISKLTTFFQSFPLITKIKNKTHPGRHPLKTGSDVLGFHALPNNLDVGQDVERRRQGLSAFKIGHPKLGPGEFPFGVSVFLETSEPIYIPCCNHKYQSICQALAFVHTTMKEYELDIIAMSRLRRTIMLITEYVPNISIDQNLVYSRMPVSSKSDSPTIPKPAQNRDWEASNTLKQIDR